MTTPADIHVTNRTAKHLARLLVLQAAILNELKDADAETRDEAKTLFEVGDAASVPGLGRVRRDKPRGSWRVVDWPAFEGWIREHAPHLIVESVAPEAMRRINRDGGAWIDKATGEVSEPAGIGYSETDAPLVVTTTEEAAEWARGVIGKTVAGELE